MRRILALGVAIVVGACCSDGAKTTNHDQPALSRSRAEQLMLRADDIKGAALNGVRSVRFTDAFRGRALATLEAQSQGMGQRGLRVEERDAERTLVFWDPRADEAVLQVAAQRRLVTPDQPDLPWAGTVRQWWARLQYTDGRWWIVDEEDLPPDRWRVM